MGVLDAQLPKAASLSPYARFGDLTFLLLLMAATALAFVLGRK
jgi:apolipoprotein N-acyltransferase